MAKKYNPLLDPKYAGLTPQQIQELRRIEGSNLRLYNSGGLGSQLSNPAFVSSHDITATDPDYEQGRSQYDDATVHLGTPDNEQQRHFNQSNWDVFGNSMAKYFGTTAIQTIGGLSNMVGGVAEMLGRFFTDEPEVEGAWNDIAHAFMGLYDNPSSRAFNELQTKLNEATMIYKSGNQQSSSIFSLENIFSGHMAGTLAQAMGFTTSSVLLGSTASSALSAVGVLGRANGVASSLVSGLSEATTEAIMAKTEFERLEEEGAYAKADAKMKQIDVLPLPEHEKELLKNNIVDEYQLDLNKVDKAGNTAGALTFALNAAINGVANYIQFGRYYESNSFKEAKKLANQRVLRETAEVDANLRAGMIDVTEAEARKKAISKNIKRYIDDYSGRTSMFGLDDEIIEGGKYVNRLERQGLLSLLKNPTTEGIQEFSQYSISDADKKVHHEELENLYANGLDAESTGLVGNLVQGVFESFVRNATNEEALLEGAIGALLGGMGSPTFRIDRSSGSPKLRLTLAGNPFIERNAANKQFEEVQLKVDEINEFLDKNTSINQRIENLAENIFFENQKALASEQDDLDKFTSIENAQLLKNLSFMAKQGRLDDMVAYYQSQEQVTEDQLKGFIDKDTAIDANGKRVGKFYDDQGNLKVTEFANEVERIKEKAKENLSMISTFRDAMDVFASQFGKVLSQDDIADLAYLSGRHAFFAREATKRMFTGANQYNDFVKEIIDMSRFLDTARNKSIYKTRKDHLDKAYDSTQALLKVLTESTIYGMYNSTDPNLSTEEKAKLLEQSLDKIGDIENTSLQELSDSLYEVLHDEEFINGIQGMATLNPKMFTSPIIRSYNKLVDKSSNHITNALKANSAYRLQQQLLKDRLSERTNTPQDDSHTTTTTTTTTTTNPTSTPQQGNIATLTTSPQQAKQSKIKADQKKMVQDVFDTPDGQEYIKGAGFGNLTAIVGNAGINLSTTELVDEIDDYLSNKPELKEEYERSVKFSKAIADIIDTYVNSVPQELLLNNEYPNYLEMLRYFVEDILKDAKFRDMLKDALIGSPNASQDLVGLLFEMHEITIETAHANGLTDLEAELDQLAIDSSTNNASKLHSIVNFLHRELASRLLSPTTLRPSNNSPKVTHNGSPKGPRVATAPPTQPPTLTPPSPNPSPNPPQPLSHGNNIVTTSLYKYFTHDANGNPIPPNSAMDSMIRTRGLEYLNRGNVAIGDKLMVLATDENGNVFRDQHGNLVLMLTAKTPNGLVYLNPIPNQSGNYGYPEAYNDASGKAYTEQELIDIYSQSNAHEVEVVSVTPSDIEVTTDTPQVLTPYKDHIEDLVDRGEAVLVIVSVHKKQTVYNIVGSGISEVELSKIHINTGVPTIVSRNAQGKLQKVEFLSTIRSKDKIVADVTRVIEKAVSDYNRDTKPKQVTAEGRFVAIVEGLNTDPTILRNIEFDVFEKDGTTYLTAKYTTMNGTNPVNSNYSSMELTDATTVDEITKWVTDYSQQFDFRYFLDVSDFLDKDTRATALYDNFSTMMTGFVPDGGRLRYSKIGGTPDPNSVKAQQSNDTKAGNRKVPNTKTFEIIEGIDTKPVLLIRNQGRYTTNFYDVSNYKHHVVEAILTSLAGYIDAHWDMQNNKMLVTSISHNLQLSKASGNTYTFLYNLNGIRAKLTAEITDLNSPIQLSINNLNTGVSSLGINLKGLSTLDTDHIKTKLAELEDLHKRAIVSNGTYEVEGVKYLIATNVIMDDITHSPSTNISYRARQMGSYANSLVREALLTGNPSNVSGVNEVVDEIKANITSLLGSKFEIVSSEVLLTTTSNDGRFIAGTPDLIAYNDKQVLIIDLKIGSKKIVTNLYSTYATTGYNAFNYYSSQLSWHKKALALHLGIGLESISTAIVPIYAEYDGRHDDSAVNDPSAILRGISSASIQTRSGNNLSLNTILTLKYKSDTKPYFPMNAGAVTTPQSSSPSSVATPTSPTPSPKNTNGSGNSSSRNGVTIRRKVTRNSTREITRGNEGIRIEDEVNEISRILPNLPNNIVLAITENLIKVGQDSNAVGVFQDAMIALYKNAPKGTYYHEAFHALYNLMLPSEVKGRINEEAKAITGSSDPIVIEEYLADKFQDFMVGRTYPNKTSFLERVLNAIKNFISNFIDSSSVTDRLFDDVANGRYSHLIVSSVEEDGGLDTTIEDIMEGRSEVLTKINGVLVPTSYNNVIGSSMSSLVDRNIVLDLEGFNIIDHTGPITEKLMNEVDGVYMNGRVILFNDKAPKAVTTIETAQDTNMSISLDSLSVLPTEVVERLNDMGISKEDFDMLTPTEREYLLSCSM